MERTKGWIALSTILWILGTLVPTSSALFTGVVPIDSELNAICGPYAYHTPTFTCASFVNGTGYFNCLNQPYNCFCTPEAPPEFQQSFQPPCKFNYGVQSCSGLVEAKYYCGQHAVSCTKRCDYLGNCYAVNACGCESGYEMPSNPQYCSYEYQADTCLTTTIIASERETVSCGVFATQAYFLCPTNATFSSSLCTTVCNCQTGTGRTPGSSVACDGVDRPCDAGDVRLACGSPYTNCTKRCQYTNANPTVMGLCVVVPGSCTTQNSLDAGPTQRNCPFDQIDSLCGPATASCRQYVSSDGTVVNTTCACTATGYPTAARQCAQFSVFTPAPYGDCQSICGPGFVNGSAHPCQYRVFKTIPPGAIPYPGPSSDSNNMKQMWWLNQGSGILTFNPQTFSFVEDITRLRQIANGGAIDISTDAPAIQCPCDASAIRLAWQVIEGAQSFVSPRADYSKLLNSRGPGYYDPYGRSFPSLDPTLYSPYRLDMTFVGSSITLYPGNQQAPIDDFYEILSCRGPSVAVLLKAAYGTTLAVTNQQLPPSNGFGQNPLTRITPIASFYTLLYNTYTTDNPATCVQIGGVFQPFMTSGPGNYGDPVQTLRTTSIRRSNGGLWVVSFVNPAVTDQYTLNTFLCNEFTNFDSFFNLGRQGIGIDNFVSTGGYVDYTFANADALSALDGSPYCGGSLRGVIQNIFPSSWTQMDQYNEVTGLNLVPAYDRLTIGANLSLFAITPPSAKGSAIANSFQNPFAYGPIQLGRMSTATCACRDGWGGPACKSNIACCTCPPGDPTCDGCPGSVANPGCLSTIFSFAPRGPGAPLRTMVYRYDGIFNSPPLLTTTNCPFLLNPRGNSSGCNPSVFNAAATTMCIHGTPIWIDDPTYPRIDCQCNPGWQKRPIVKASDSCGTSTAPGFQCGSVNVNNANVPIGPCNTAGFGPISGLSNCPVANGVGACAYSDANRWGPLPPECMCGGNGLIDSVGECICNIGWLKDSTGCCSVPNECVSCPAGSHTTFCNKTATARGNWVCSDETSDGRWSGPCCNDFIPYTPCFHGVRVTGEVVFNYTNNQLVPLVFNPNSLPGVNPNGMVCMCSGDQTWTGASCNQSPCPVFNGLPCGGFGNCVNGQCMQSNICQRNTNRYGCACQYDITNSCRGGSQSNEVCSGAAKGLCQASLTPALTIGCSCVNGFSGNNCQNSPCGAGNCNEAEAAGQCVRNATDPNNYYCNCYTEAVQACVSAQDCLWAGPTCEFDITSSCGVVTGTTARTCNLHGNCNISSGNGTCECTDGWLSTGNRCTTQPCNPACGVNGVCVATQSGPQCSCFSHWSPGGVGSDRCTISDCIYGEPLNNLPNSPCVCVNRTLSYDTQCTQMNCPASNEVPCGQPNCAVEGLEHCRSPGGQGCIIGCPAAGSQFLATCTNGQCSQCPEFMQYNFFTKICENICAPFPNTIDIRYGLGQPVQCICRNETLWAPAPSYCREQTCLNDGTYQAESKKCLCVPGFKGDRCEQQFCSGHGTFYNTTASGETGNGYNCSCFFPYTGRECNENICLNGGVPAVDPQRAPDSQCSCPFAYRGNTCEFSRCGLNGRPNLDGSACTCSAGYVGIYCQVFQCIPPNTISPNNTCICNENFFGPACTYFKCGPAGSFFNGTCHCFGVATPQNVSGFVNCTGNSCGPFGSPNQNMQACNCGTRSTFYPTLSSNRSVNCVPNCINGGTFNNTPPYNCTCPPGTLQPYCDRPPPASSTGSPNPFSSSTGFRFSSTGSQNGTTGPHSSTARNDAPQQIRRNKTLAILLAAAVSWLISKASGCD